MTPKSHKKYSLYILSVRFGRPQQSFLYKKYTESAILIKAASAHDIKHINKSKLQHATKWNAQIRKMRPFPFFTLFLLSWIGWNPHHRFWLPFNSDGYRAKPSPISRWPPCITKGRVPSYVPSSSLVLWVRIPSFFSAFPHETLWHVAET